MPWYSNTLFVITADHATVTYHPEYKTAVGDLAIPLIFFHPGDSSLRGRQDGIVQQIDIMPTVLGYLGYDKPYLAFGKDRFADQAPDFAVCYNGMYHWFEGDHLLQFDGQQTKGLYRFKTDRLLRENLMA